MTQVQCRYCGLSNDAQERRCVRCMRRLHLAAPRSAPESYPLAAAAAATAPALQPVPSPTLAVHTQTKDARPAATFQQALFQDGPAASKVIPIPTLTPLRSPARESSPVRRVAPRTGAAPRRSSDLQRPFEFNDTSDGTVKMDGIYCDAPV